MARAFYSIGHSTRSAVEFVALLQENGVQCLVDVRSMPGSRKYPQFNADALEQSLAGAGIGYQHQKALGGRRSRSLPAHDRRNAMWRNRSFRYYADYALSADFARALDALEHSASAQTCACMCAEAVWWRCHRRIIADHLLARGHAVYHIMGPGKVTTATLTPGARVAGRVVTYPADDYLFSSQDQ